MKKSIFCVFLLSGWANAYQLQTVFNPFTGKPDYIAVSTSTSVTLPGGTDQEIQYNNGGTTFGGAAFAFWDNVFNNLLIGGNTFVSTIPSIAAQDSGGDGSLFVEVSTATNSIIKGSLAGDSVIDFENQTASPRLFIGRAAFSGFVTDPVITVRSATTVGGFQVGIGSANPQSTLDVNGTGLFRGPSVSSVTYGLVVGSATLLNVASGTQCLHANSSGQVTGTGSDCSAGGSVTLVSSGVAFGSPTNTVTQDTNTFVWDNTNKRLGVNVSTPAYKLDVTGDINMAPSFTYRYKGSPIMNADVSLANYWFGGAGNLTASGPDNTAIGPSSQAAITSGEFNMSMGASSLQSTNTGNFNLAIGVNAEAGNISGNSNVGLGLQALQSNTTGNKNVGIGGNALFDFNDAGGQDDGNVAIGYNAGRGITTGKANTIIGANTIGLPSGLSSNVIIADGNGNSRFMADSNGNSAVGISTPIANVQFQTISQTTDKYEFYSATSTVLFHVSVSTSGHFLTGGASPTLSSCGSSPSVSGDDNEGTITVGGGIVTACTLAFSSTWGATPTCVISDNSTAITGDISSLSATSMTTSFSASLGGGIIYYRCGCSGPTCL